MRPFLLGLSISIAFILGCVTSQHMPDSTAAQAAAGPGHAGGTVEYHCIDQRSLLSQTVSMPGRGGGQPDLQQRLNELGQYGWMPASIQSEAYQCFLRVTPPPAAMRPSAPQP